MSANVRETARRARDAARVLTTLTREKDRALLASPRSTRASAGATGSGFPASS